MKSILVQTRRGGSWLAGMAVMALMVLMALMSSPLAVRADQNIDQMKPASATGRVEIESVSGTVTVAGTDKAEVHVTGTLDEHATLEFSSEGDRTVIKVKWEKDWFQLPGHGNRICKLNIQVPQGSAVSAEVVSADCSVDGVSGSLELQSVSGDVTVSGKPSRVAAKSVSGDVKIVAATARVEAESVSGAIRLQGPSGEAKAKSVSGDINVSGGPFSNLEASAVSGDLVFDGDFGSGARCDLSSHSGAVDLRLPASVSATFEIETFSGDISCDFGGKAERKSQYAPGESLNFTAGSGDAQVKANSFSGSVKVEKK